MVEMRLHGIMDIGMSRLLRAKSMEIIIKLHYYMAYMKMD